MRGTFITDVGYTKVGDHWDKSLSELAFLSAKEMLCKKKKAPEAIIVANALADVSSSQGNLGTVIADALMLEGVPSYRVEASGASGGVAINLATHLIESDSLSSVLVVGVEKMRDLEPAKVMFAQALSESADYSQFFGISFAAMNALLARQYMHEFGISREKLSAFPVIAHKNSSTAEHAQFKKKFSAEEVSRSEIVADPLRVLDCAPVGDGAASVLLVSGEALNSEEGGVKKEVQEEERRLPVEVVSSECATARLNFFERDNMLSFGATRKASERALRKAHLTIEDMDFVELNDSYSELAALSAEAIGLSKPGQACIDADSGKFDLNGQFPISTFGGMKGRGYPLGAAGVYQACEAFMQLTEGAGFNQVPNASYGLVQSSSGIDGYAASHVFASTSSSSPKNVRTRTRS